jgi:hypothetical protein
VSESRLKNSDTSRAQSFGNSPEKTRTRKRPAIAKEGSQNKTLETAAGQSQTGKDSSEVS